MIVVTVKVAYNKKDYTTSVSDFLSALFIR